MKDEHIDVREILERAKQGDNEAFSIIYTNYYSPIYRYIFIRTKSREDSEDIVQEVFLKAYKSLQSFTQTESSPLAYFYTIARNTLIDHRRKKRVTTVEDQEAVDRVKDDATPNPEASAITAEEAKMIASYIKNLTDEQQEVVVLKFMNGLSNKEVADIMDKNEDAVRQLQTRALRALRTLYTNDHE